MFNPNEHLMDLKGKQYLKVMWRLVWFREDKPTWCIDTKLEQLTDNHAVFSAKISDENGIQKASGYGSESIKDFRDYIEKAETKAIGRALAMLGYGTQFAPELDEGERIVDSPAQRKKAAPKPKEQEAPPAPPKEKIVCGCCGKEITDVKFKSGATKTVDQIVNYSKQAFGLPLCYACTKNAIDEANKNKEETPC